jgi:hypothetical protein
MATLAHRAVFLILIILFCGDSLFGTISSQRSRKVPLWHTGLFFFGFDKFVLRGFAFWYYFLSTQ